MEEDIKTTLKNIPWGSILTISGDNEVPEGKVLYFTITEDGIEGQMILTVRDYDEVSNETKISYEEEYFELYYPSIDHIDITMRPGEPDLYSIVTVISAEESPIDKGDLRDAEGGPWDEG